MRKSLTNYVGVTSQGHGIFADLCHTFHGSVSKLIMTSIFSYQQDLHEDEFETKPAAIVSQLDTKESAYIQLLYSIDEKACP